MVIWTLAKKDLRLLVRDMRAMVILLAMPLIFIVVLGVAVGEDYGKRDKLHVSVLNLDKGLPQAPGEAAPAFPPDGSWSARIIKDLTDTSDIQVEMLENQEEAKRLLDSGRRPAVLVLGPNFSKNVHRCSFLADGVNPFNRDGVNLEKLDAELTKDQRQIVSAAVVEQATQGTFLRVVLPWMIGRAFEKIGDPDFLALMGKQPQMPPMVRSFLTGELEKDYGSLLKLPIFPKKLVGSKPLSEQRKDLGDGIKDSLQKLFPEYNLTAKTWASLTRKEEHTDGSGDKVFKFKEDGEGWLKRGAARYQLLVPSFLVMFAFFLVLTVGWLFVAERRQGTLLRLRAAPLARWQILIGKLLPCYLMSVFQGFFLLLAGKVVFNMSYGPAPLLLVPLVLTTSLAAMGLAMLIAALARTETQVAVYGTLLVLVLAGLSGSIMVDRSQIPETLRTISLFTPHAWALDAYRDLLGNPLMTYAEVNIAEVAQCCGVLALFGVGFVTLAWWLLRLE